MYYTIRHVTRFTYDVPISESVMEARMQPRTEGPQRCIRFGLSTAPAARVKMYPDQAACRRLFHGCYTKRCLLAQMAARACSSSKAQGTWEWRLGVRRGRPAAARTAIGLVRE